MNLGTKNDEKFHENNGPAAAKRQQRHKQFHDESPKVKIIIWRK
jgi:hypothetical protein